MSAPPLRYGLSYLLALAALFAILWSLVRDAELVISLLAGVLGVGAVLALAGFGLVRLTGRLRGGVGVAWRYGLANVSRRGGDSVVQIVAFGLGLMVLLLLAVGARSRLLAVVGARSPLLLVTVRISYCHQINPAFDTN